MGYKKAPLILFAASLTLLLTLTVASPIPLQNNQRAKQDSQVTETRPALKQDLLSETSEKILEIVEASYQLTESGLHSSSIRVRNLSKRNVTAVGIIWTVKFTNLNTCHIEQLVDYRLHKDMVNAKGTRPFAPYEERVIPRLTSESFDGGQAIESVEVRFAFAEFEDAGGVGVGKSELYGQLLSQRKGAEIYKRWIESDYGDDPQRVAAVARKLSGEELPNDKELENGRAKHGALIYRQWMRDVLNKGEKAFREQMHRQARKQD